MSFITITKGGGGGMRNGETVEVPNGVYSVTLVEIHDPKTVTARQGPKSGEDIDLIDWDFAIDEGPLDGTVIQASTSTASGPKSKMYAYLTALFGGQSPPAGTALEKKDLQGRSALATIRTDESGWPRIDNLGAKPNWQPQVAQPASAPVVAPAPAAGPAAAAPAPAAAAVPARDQVAPQQNGNLPF